jgi:hypothetical protein
MAKGVAYIVRFLLPFMGWLYRFHTYMAKVRINLRSIRE